MTLETVMVIEPDDHRADSYVESALEGLTVMGLDVDPTSVYSAPFGVEQGPHLQAELQKVAQLFDPPTAFDYHNSRSTYTTHSPEKGTILDYAIVLEPDSEQTCLKIDVPAALDDRLDQYCLKHQVAKSTVVRLLIESHLR